MNPIAKENRKTTRVVIAEDQGMVLGALAALLEIEGDISVVAQVRNGKEALEAVFAQKPDVLITDIEMPFMTGLDAAGRPLAGAAVDRGFLRAIFVRKLAHEPWEIQAHRRALADLGIDPDLTAGLAYEPVDHRQA